jgi:hypothetical protein
MYWYEGRSSQVWIKGLNVLAALCVASIIGFMLLCGVVEMYQRGFWLERLFLMNHREPTYTSVPVPAQAQAPTPVAPEPTVATPENQPSMKVDNNGLNYKLDLSRGQPQDWELRLTNRGKNVTFANRRFEVQQIDTGAALTQKFDLTGKKQLIIGFTQNVGKNYWGMGTNME